MTTTISLANLQLGVALSGGGVRASVFHLGVLGRLAADALLEQVTAVSTVSGGTLVTGLIYKVAGYQWPQSSMFLSDVLPEVKRYMTTVDLQRDYIVRSFTRPWYLLQGRAKIVAQSLEHCWGITAMLNDVPLEPRWVLNATAYETGRDWRFIPQKRMGDYRSHYVRWPQIRLSDAMAASAAYPGLIGPLVIKTNQYKWFKYGGQNEELDTTPAFDKVHLWDGGLYDNLGVESLFKIQDHRYRDGVNFLVVSDASPGLAPVTYSPHFYNRGMRLVEIAMDQVRGLRARTLVNHFRQNANSGVYLKIGNTGRKILADSITDSGSHQALLDKSLADMMVHRAASFATTLRRLEVHEYELLFQHGWEVADHTLLALCPKMFGHQPIYRG